MGLLLGQCIADFDRARSIMRWSVLVPPSLSRLRHTPQRFVYPPGTLVCGQDRKTKLFLGTAVGSRSPYLEG